MKRNLLLLTVIFTALVAVPFLGCDSAGSTNRGFAKFATIKLELHPNSPAAADASAVAQSVPVLLFRVRGDANQDVLLNGVDVTLTGTGSGSAVSLVNLYIDDGAGSSGVFDVSGDTQIGGAVFSAGVADFLVLPAVSIPAGSTLDLFVVYNFSSSTPPTGGDTFGARIAANADVKATGALSGLEAIVEGAPIDSTNLVSILGRLQINTGTSMPLTGTHTVSTADVPMFQVNLLAPDENVLVNTLRITSATNPGVNTQVAGVDLIYDQNGNGMYEAGTDAVIESGRTFSAGDPTINFTVNRTLVRNNSQNWLVLYDLGASHTHMDTFTVSIAADTDVDADGVSSGNPVVVTLTPDPIQGNPQSVATHAVINLTPGNETPADGGTGTAAVDVLMLHFTITETTSIEAVDITAMTFTITGGGSPAGNPQNDITRLRLFLDDGDTLFEPGGAGTDDTVLGWANINTSNQAPVTITGGHTIPAGGSSSFYVALDFNGNAGNGATFQVSITSADITGTGQTSLVAPTITGGPITGRTVSIIPVGTLTVTASIANPVLGSVNRANTDIPMLALNLAMDAQEACDISSITLTASGDGDDLNGISTVDLYYDQDVNGVVTNPPDVLLGSGTFGADNGTAVITLTTPRNIAASSNEDWLIVVTFSASNVWVGQTFQVSLSNNTHVTATGTTTQAPVIVTGAPVHGGLQAIEGIWTQLTPGGASTPPGRWGHTCVYEGSTPRLIMHAGTAGDLATGGMVIPYNDTWELRLTSGSETWNQLVASAQGPTNSNGFQFRWWHAAVYDSNRSHLVIYGGRDHAAILSDCWELDLSQATLSWSGPTVLTNGRMLITADYDVPNSRMLFYGGTSGVFGGTITYNNDVVSIPLPTPSWNTITPSNTPPPSRAGYGLGIDPAGSGRLLLTVGIDSTSIYTATHTFNLATTGMGALSWTAQPISNLFRWICSSAVDPDGKQLLIYGGEDGSNPNPFPAPQQAANNVESFDFTTNQWFIINTTGGPPPFRESHAAVWDRVNKRMIVVFGCDTFFPATAGSNTVYTDVWELK